MSNYGYDYGDLEEYSEQRRRERERLARSLKSLYAIERRSDGFLLSKYGQLVFEEEVNENTLLEVYFNEACRVRRQIAEITDEELWVKKVYVECEKAKEWGILD